MKRKLLSPALQAKQKRNAAICKLHSKMKNDYAQASELYRAIGIEVGCCTATVITVLQQNNII